MKKGFRLIIAILLALLLCIPAVFFITYYTKPMEDVSYNLSISAEDGQDWGGSKGWSVFIDEAGSRTELTSDGFGGYMGLTYPGQTFYYSRELNEQLDSPALQIGVVNRNVSVFLDDTMIYTDCPDADNRIGYLNLPMLQFDRTEPVTVSLPPDYFGKTLTIAQSSPVYSETLSSDMTVWPCDVMLYCGYAYESSLIASTTKTMIPAVLLFALELLLATVFIWNSSVKRLDLRIPVLGLAVLFQLCGRLAQADFFYQYFGLLPVDLVWVCFHLSISALLLFIALYAKHLRPLFFLITLLQWVSVFLSIFPQTTGELERGDLSLFLSELPQRIGFLALLFMFIGVFWEWKRKVSFFRYQSVTALIVIGGYLIFLFGCFFASPEYLSGISDRILGEARLLLPNFTLKLLWNLTLISTLAAVIFDLFEKETEQRTNVAVLKEKNKLTMESYENLQYQSEEVHMLRHDMMKHYTVLQTLAKDSPEKVSDYLDELIGQIQAVRPVVSTRNQMLNILLNGKLNAASSKGISVEIERSDAPETLPLTDAETCGLFLNILENAIHASNSPYVKSPYIRLDFHCKNQHFVFTCENAKAFGQYAKKKRETGLFRRISNTKTPAPKHGYGLKIIHQIMKRWGDNMVSIEETDTTYKITVIIPLTD